MADKKPKKTISFTVSEEKYEEIKRYAEANGHGGPYPASTFAHFAVHAYMKKYPLSKAEEAEAKEGDGIPY